MKKNRFVTFLAALLSIYQGVLAQPIQLPAKLSPNHNEAMYGFYDGKLLIFGGKAFDGFKDSCLMLDLSNPKEWIGVSKMPTPRLDGGTHFYNGKFYIVGGMESSDFGSGETKYTFCKDVLAYDYVTSTYTSISQIPNPEWGGTSVLVGSKIYILGGFLQNQNPDSLNYGSFKKTVQIYDIVTNTWSIDIDVPFISDYPGATAIGTDIYLIGNKIDTEPWAFKGSVTTAGIIWAPLPEPPVRTFAHGVGMLNGKVYVAAGAIIQSGGPLNTKIHCFDPATQSWSKVADFPQTFMGLFSPVMPSDGANLYYIGGTGNQYTYKIPAASAYVSTKNNGSTVSIYPNPVNSNGLLIISASEKLLGPFSLFDILGKKIQDLNLSLNGINKYEINLKNLGLREGTYFLRSQIGAAFEMQKFQFTP